MEKPDLAYRLIVKNKPGLAEFVLEVTNQGSQEQTFEFSTGQEFDFAVTGEGREVWRWSGDMIFIQAFHNLVLKKGQSKSYAASWDYKTLMSDRVAPGDYVLRAYFWGISRQEPVVERDFVVVSDSV